MLINNKEKQFAGGNWSSNKWTKEHTELNVPVVEVEEVKHKSKKKKKPKAKYVYEGHICPFCMNELPDDIEAMKNDPCHQWRWRIFHKKVDVCPRCHAHVVKECPACKHGTWYSPRQKWYKHQGRMGCGFEGMRKE